MKNFRVVRKSDGETVYRYSNAVTVEWNGFEFSTHDHVEEPAEVEPEEVIVPAEWYMNVGPFYDRFGMYKIPILASSDSTVQAIIKDASVRKYIDIKGRRAELTQAIQLIQSKGYPISLEAILDVKPNSEEVYRG